MKRFFLILTVLFACGSFCAAAPSELDIYNELNIYINARYYPGVIEQSELLEKNYPESVFIISARIARGQAQRQKKLSGPCFLLCGLVPTSMLNAGIILDRLIIMTETILRRFLHFIQPAI